MMKKLESVFTNSYHEFVLEFGDGSKKSFKFGRGNSPLNEEDPISLLERLQQWREVDLRVISDEDLEDALRRALQIYPSPSPVVLENKSLFRIRWLEKPEKFTSIKDVWYPPKEKIEKIGRLNKIRESVFYCSFDPTTPIFECKINPGDWFAIMRYKIKEGAKLRVGKLETAYPPPDLNKVGLMNYAIISQFFYNEFTKHVGVGTEYLYRGSNLIYRTLSHGNEGFIYPSIASTKKGHNLILKPESVNQKIDFVEMLVCKLIEAGETGFKVEIEHKAILGQSGDLEYVEVSLGGDSFVRAEQPLS